MKKPAVKIVDTETIVPCRGCDGRCCSSYLVNINHKDAFRIAAALYIDPYEFTFASYDDEYKDGSTDNGFPTFMIEGRAHALAIEYDEKEDDKCVFLMQIGNEMRCGVHNCKPGLCRIYPLGVTEDWEMEDQADDLVCTKQWVINRSERDATEQFLKAYAAEVREFEQICKAWNESGTPDRSFREFIDYMIEYCSHEASHEAGPKR